MELRPEPCTLVILGACGDLSRRKLLPALHNLALDGVLPEHTAVVAFARREHGDESYRRLARDCVEKHSRQPIDAQAWPRLERSLYYQCGSLDDPRAYVELRKRLEELELDPGIPRSRVFYLSVPPSLFETCIRGLHEAGLVHPHRAGSPFARVIVEKPVGRDLDSAAKINDELSRVCDERQIFRIDHYLGKETVQNILVMRFGNAIFEPLWNKSHIDHVQITVAEEVGVGTRGGYYEETGALRDMVQNHILQLLCLTAMEPPWSLTADVVRDHKLEVLRCLRPITGEDVGRYVVRAQYGAGFVGDVAVPGYRQERGVANDSITETYVALRVFIDNWRWSGVPFYLRTAKRMPRRATEIAVQFKDAPPILYNRDRSAPLDPNLLTLRIQPDEGLSLRISAKRPGPRLRTSAVEMDFAYGAAFGGSSPEAYERLLLDVLAGDATHFMRRDAVEASWAFIDPIQEAWERSRVRWLPEYEAGSDGPIEAERLIGEDGRHWRVP
ncbi:MAG: glucose-6-phosphate dehydrogenase [Myxococcota bacterium]